MNLYPGVSLTIGSYGEVNKTINEIFGVDPHPVSLQPAKRKGWSGQSVAINALGNPMKTFLYTAFFVVLVAMTWVTVTASLDRSVLVAAVDIWNDPWGKATLFDAYFAFLTVYLWIAYREQGWWRRLLWLLLILTLGNFAIAAYFLLALRQLGPEQPWTGLFERAPTASRSQPAR